MDEDQIHMAVSNDGTKIAGRVQGQGAPIAGAGHVGPLTAPEPVAHELVGFFSS